MTTVVGFLLFLVITLAFLGAAVYSGRQAKRKVHLPCVAGAVVCLLVTIYYAEQLGTLYDLETAGIVTPVHLFLAKTTTLAYLAPVFTGVRTIRNQSARKTHGKVAYFVLLMTVLTAATGAAMVFMSTPL
jgi:heme A synthase